MITENIRNDIIEMAEELKKVPPESRSFAAGVLYGLERAAEAEKENRDKSAAAVTAV